MQTQVGADGEKPQNEVDVEFSLMQPVYSLEYTESIKPKHIPADKVLPLYLFYRYHSYCRECIHTVVAGVVGEIASCFFLIIARSWGVLFCYGTDKQHTACTAPILASNKGASARLSTYEHLPVPHQLCRQHMQTRRDIISIQLSLRFTSCASNHTLCKSRSFRLHGRYICSMHVRTAPVRRVMTRC